MQDDMQIVHDEALQAMDMLLQQHSIFCTIEQCGYDDRTENAKLCLSADLLVPEDTTKIAKDCMQILELNSRSEPQFSWMTRFGYRKLETGSTGNWKGTGSTGKMVGNGSCTKICWESCHGLGL